MAGAARPLPNRVDAFGGFFSTPARGALMGNRGGRLHDAGRTLGTRRWASRRWICCALAFKGRRRTVWGAGYTELFFLDEATALAAGHRPCFECRRAAALSYARAAFPGGASADVVDAALHAERLGPRVAISRADAQTLPDGAMVGEASTRAAWLRVADGWRRWTPFGYESGAPLDAPLVVLTPETSLRALRAGYRPIES
jgi:hypothetical protein